MAATCEEKERKSMAKFKMTVIKQGEGNEKNDDTFFAAVEAVELEEGEEELCFPEEYEGLPVTHIGCAQGYKEAHIEYGDWHHPTHRADEYAPARFHVAHTPIELPKTVRRVYLHSELEVFILRASPETVFEIHPENKHLGIAPDGRVTLKCWL